jgi:hypothetical protein
MVKPVINGKKSTCPYYQSWVSMIKRCYSHKLHARFPTYKDCSVTKDWLNFSVFREWMKGQDWEGRQLDKDILIPENKEYGPNTCIFIGGAINSLLSDHAAKRGDFPQGVCFHKLTGKYRSYCKVNGKQKHLGLFTAIEPAEHAYLTFKSYLVRQIALEQEASGNPKLQTALVRHAELLMNKADAIDNET